MAIERIGDSNARTRHDREARRVDCRLSEVVDALIAEDQANRLAALEGEGVCAGSE